MMSGSVRLPISSSPSSSSFTLTGSLPADREPAPRSPETAIHSGDLSSEAPRAWMCPSRIVGSNGGVSH